MRIFLSYSRKDKLLCDAVIKELEVIDDIEVFIDISQPMPGTSLPERIKNEISICDLFVVLLTDNGLTSPWVTTEVAWAISVGKKIIPVLQEGRSLNEIPGLRGDLEYIQYNPTAYDLSIKNLGNSIGKTMKPSHANHESQDVVPSGKTRRVMERLDQEQVINLLVLKGADLAPSLERRLIQNAKATISEFFLDPRYSALTNVGTLATDTNVIVIRKETMHSLLRASSKGNPSIFRREGYEAGSLFGLGVVKWFLEKSSATLGIRGLPRDPFGVLDACARIDEASGWGKIEVVKLKPQSGGAVYGWTGFVSVKNNFLGQEVGETKSKESVERYTAYRAFWRGYLEGTFSAALGVWYGMWAIEGEEMPLFEVRCDDEKWEATDLIFQISVRPPSYGETFNNLQRELFCPYLQGENARVVRSARGVIEGFVRELAETDATNEDVRGIVRGLSWLGQNVDNTAKSATAFLQETRTFLHEHIHDVREPTEGETRRILRITTAALLMACRDIMLDSKMKSELKSLLHREGY